MHRQLQQFKEKLLIHGSFYASLLYIAALHVYSGEILFKGLATHFGSYLPFLHLRITLHDLLAIIVLLLFLYQTKSTLRALLSKIQKYGAPSAFIVISCLLITVFLALSAQYTLANALQTSVFLVLLTSGFHFLSFFLNLSALAVSIWSVINSPPEQQTTVAKALFVAVAVQITLAITQLLFHGPIYGPLLKWTGQPEIFTSKSLWGIHEFIRAYGTTPHPNILAAIGTFYAYLALRLHQPHRLRLALFLGAAILVGTTLSKLGIIALVVILLTYSFKTLLGRISIQLSPKLLFSALIFLLALSLLFEWVTLQLHWSPPYLQSRAVIQQAYLELLGKNPILLLTGTGFTLATPALLAQGAQLATPLFWGSRMLSEPPHNALLLIIVEFGLIGFGWCAFLITRIFRAVTFPLENWEKFALLSLLVIWGGFDHLLLY
jgi:hypothetical protein